MVKEEEMYLKESDYVKNILFFIGVMLVAISYLLERIHGVIISEVVLIIAWLAIWEAANIFLFRNNKRLFKIKRLKKIAECEIVFKGVNNNERNKS